MSASLIKDGKAVIHITLTLADGKEIIAKYNDGEVVATQDGEVVGSVKQVGNAVSTWMRYPEIRKACQEFFFSCRGIKMPT